MEVKQDIESVVHASAIIQHGISEHDRAIKYLSKALLQNDYTTVDRLSQRIARIQEEIDNERQRLMEISNRYTTQN